VGAVVVVTMRRCRDGTGTGYGCAKETKRTPVVDDVVVDAWGGPRG